MADIKQSEKLMFESILGMAGGYVLEFSNGTFQEFVFNVCKIDIYQSKYELYGDSKAKRLRAFWQLESNITVGKLLKELLACWETTNLLKNISVEKDKKLHEACTSVTNRLLGISDVSQNQTHTVNDFLNKEFKEISLEELNIDTTVVEILKSRLNEINKSIQSGAALSAVIMCGSVMEGLLLGIASAKMKDFNTSTVSPKDKNTGKVLQFHNWTLSNFIDVAYDLGFLGLDVKKYSHSLRDFRNYIHPYQQMSSKFNPDIETAKISWQVLKATITDLKKRLN